MSKKKKGPDRSEPTTPQQVPGTPDRMTHVDIRQRAVLTRLSLRQWSATITDREITEDVARRNGMADDMGRFEKKLFNKGALAKIQSACSRIEGIHKRYTLPWSEWGTRILAGPAIPKYRSEMTQAIDDLEQTVKDELSVLGPTGLTRYEELKNEARQSLGSSFRDADYPTLDKVKERFRARFVIRPIPDVADFRIDLGAEVVKQIGDEIRESIQKDVDAGMRQVFERLHEFAERLVKALQEPEERPQLRTLAQISAEIESTPDLSQERMRELLAEAQAVGAATPTTTALRQDLFKYVGKFLEDVPLLNVTGDSKLEEFRLAVSKLIDGADAKQLRDNASDRKQARTEAEAILAQMNDFLGLTEEVENAA